MIWRYYITECKAKDILCPESEPAERCCDVAEARRHAVNMVVQGTSTDLLKLARMPARRPALQLLRTLLEPVDGFGALGETRD